MSPEQLAEVDLALVNLLCAEGLPGSEGLDVAKILQTLDLWTIALRQYTDAHFYQFKRNPAEFKNLEADFRMLSLITALQLKLGVHYNMETIRDPDFGDSKDQFIHGLVGSDNGGTCVSMPTLYVALGRRLGYPLKLVQAKTHFFCRWEGNGERLNIEGASRGMQSYVDDSFYRTWPALISDEEVARGYYLKSLSPSEEFAVFLAARGHCLTDHGRYAEALAVYREAAERMQTPDYEGFVAITEAIVEGRVDPVQVGGKPMRGPESPEGP